MGNLRRITALWIVLLLLFTGVAAAQEQPEKQKETETTEQAQKAEQQQDANFTYLQKMKEFIKARYKYEVSDIDLLEGALRKVVEENPQLLEQAIEGMFDSLDQHSTFFYEDQYENFTTIVGGQFGGIGIIVTNRDGYITILSPIDGTPGKRAGLKSGDRIVFVNEIDVSSYSADMAIPLMRGEPGALVTLGIKREGNEETLYFDIVREIIKLNPIHYKIIEDDIGYIEISKFNANTDEYLIEALDSFDEVGVKKLIIDVRNNSGGSLDQAVKVAQHFVPKGPIVYIEYKEDELEMKSSELEALEYEVAVLINEGSASASEILAGAIQDTQAGKVIGVKSFGKGTVQQLLPLKIGGAVKMTVARYLTPNKKVIDGEGIQPDIEVENITEKIDMSTLEHLSILRKPTLGDTGKDILAAEQRLKLLGYNVDTPDETLDQKTFQAIKDFQTEQKLFPYGILDFTTQTALEKAIKELEKEVDKQLEKAIEVLSE